MFVMAIMLALISAWIEIKMVRGNATFRKLMENGFLFIPGRYMSLVFSIALSVVLGELFGAAGLIVLFGGLLSTVMTNIYYPQMEKIDEIVKSMRSAIDGTPAAIQQIKDFKNQCVKLWADVRVPLADFLKIIIVILKIITLPLRLLRSALAFYSEHAEQVSASVTNIKDKAHAASSKAAELKSHLSKAA